MFRTGLGVDYHQLAEGLPLRLGGVRVDADKGCMAHSDGDVLLHALCDALLGALALGDIGKHFPDTDETYKNKESCFFLAYVYDLVQKRGYILENMDAMILLEQPKIQPYIPAMQGNIAALMQTAKDSISIKATTTEGMGFIGRQEGIAAQVIVLLKKI